MDYTNSDSLFTISGTWVFNESLSAVPDYTLYKVNFTTNGMSVVGIYYYADGGRWDYIYKFDDWGNLDVTALVYGTDGWRDQSYRTVDFGTTPQTVDEEFYEWFTANAVKQMKIREIIGNTTATPNPRPDWNQTDTTKADYILNKPEVLTEDEIIQIIRAYEANPYKLSGTWMFNANISEIPSTEYVNFISNGNKFYEMFLYDGILMYRDEGNDEYPTYAYYKDKWPNEAFWKITFIGVQSVSEEFYNWFTANATSTTTDETGLENYVTKSEFNDYVKTALTTNAIELTAEEKAAVRNWIGAAATLGSFTFLDCEETPHEVTFELGMTWIDFIMSGHHRGDVFDLDGEDVVDYNGHRIATYDYQYMTEMELLVNHETYYCEEIL